MVDWSTCPFQDIFHRHLTFLFKSSRQFEPFLTLITLFTIPIVIVNVIIIIIKMTGGTTEVRSDKKLTLLTFDI